MDERDNETAGALSDVNTSPAPGEVSGAAGDSTSSADASDEQAQVEPVAAAEPKAGDWANSDPGVPLISTVHPGTDMNDPDTRERIRNLYTIEGMPVQFCTSAPRRGAKLPDGEPFAVYAALITGKNDDGTALLYVFQPGGPPYEEASVPYHEPADGDDLGRFWRSLEDGK